MSVLEPNTVDLISLDEQTNRVTLTIADHLNWDTDLGGHLDILQSKLNTYISFIESSEIYDTYPDAEEKKVVIEIVFKHEPSFAAQEFLFEVKRVTRIAGISVETRTAAMSSEEFLGTPK